MDAVGVVFVTIFLVLKTPKELARERTMTMRSQESIDLVHQDATREVWFARIALPLLLGGFILQIVSLHV